MRRLCAIARWILEGTLMLLALAALVLWPASRGRNLGLIAERLTSGPAGGERRWYTAECRDGRVVVSHYRRHASAGPWLDDLRRAIASGGAGWHWRRWSEPYTWDPAAYRGRWGPLRWDAVNDNDADGQRAYGYYAAPLWTVALAAGAWPAASIALAIRRRRRRTRAAREGLCNNCGYDLRATPSPSGERLAVCPECGAADTGRKRRS